MGTAIEVSGGQIGKLLQGQQFWLLGQAAVGHLKTVRVTQRQGTDRRVRPGDQRLSVGQHMIHNQRRAAAKVARTYPSGTGKHFQNVIVARQHTHIILGHHLGATGNLSQSVGVEQVHRHRAAQSIRTAYREARRNRANPGI